MIALEMKDPLSKNYPLRVQKKLTIAIVKSEHPCEHP